VNRLSSELGRLGVRRGVAGPTVLFYDTFTGANNTPLASRAPDVDVVGGGWITDAIYQIQSNTAARVSGAGAAIAYFESGVSDGLITLLLKTTNSSTQSGLVVRYVDANNYWWLTVNNAGSMRINEVSGGILTQRAALVRTLLASTFYPASIELTVNNIAYTLQGQTISYASSAHATATKHGLLLVTAGGADDYQVEST